MVKPYVPRVTVGITVDAKVKPYTNTVRTELVHMPKLTNITYDGI